LESRKVDRRIARTRRRLQEAIGTLILQKGYDSISVQDILDQADVGRSTFYGHFNNKAELLLSGFENLEEEIAKDRPGDPLRKAERYENYWSFSLVFLRHAGDHLPIFTALLGRLGGQLVTQHLQSLISELFRASVRSRLPGSADAEARLDMLACHVAGSLLGMTAWWLEHGTPFTPEQMSDFYRRVTKPGVDAFLEPSKGRPRKPAR